MLVMQSLTHDTCMVGTNCRHCMAKKKRKRLSNLTHEKMSKLSSRFWRKKLSKKLKEKKQKMYRTRTPFLVWVSRSFSLCISLFLPSVSIFSSASLFFSSSLSLYVGTYRIHYVYWNSWHHSDECLIPHVPPSHPFIVYCQICIFIHLLYLNVLYRAKTRMITGHKGPHGSFRGVA